MANRRCSCDEIATLLRVLSDAEDSLMREQEWNRHPKYLCWGSSGVVATRCLTGLWHHLRGPNRQHMVEAVGDEDAIGTQEGRT
jgi:hypothetical protein